MSGALNNRWPLDIVLMSSPVYWPDESQFQQFAQSLQQAILEGAELDPADLRFHLSYGELPEDQREALAAKSTLVFLPMSGGCQPAMIELAGGHAHIGLFNAYLPESGLPMSLSHEIMHKNGHPACTDTFAYLRQAGEAVSWLFNLEDLAAFARASQAVSRLKQARLLKIGETEPWVINSERDPQAYQDRLGIEVIPIDREVLYERCRQVDDADVEPLIERWRSGAQHLVEVDSTDIREACRVIRGMEHLLGEHEADGLSMACFAMIGDINTTSCLALSFLNDSADFIGACEGDLEAGVTLFLLKALGADFIWIGNPIIHADDSLELVHCTAPTCGCGMNLNYSLMRHHESGRGVAPEVQLPKGRPVSLARIGGGLEHIKFYRGRSEAVGDKLPACHTQVHVKLEDATSQDVLANLLGTHLVLTYGDYAKELAYVSRFLGLKANTEF